MAVPSAISFGTGGAEGDVQSQPRKGLRVRVLPWCCGDILRELRLVRVERLSLEEKYIVVSPRAVPVPCRELYWGLPMMVLELVVDLSCLVAWIPCLDRRQVILTEV